jgi:hypothetical protein
VDIVTDGVHGVLTEPSADDSERQASHVAAIDKARRNRFNGAELRSRAETFSVDRFREGEQGGDVNSHGDAKVRRHAAGRGLRDRPVP